MKNNASLIVDCGSFYAVGILILLIGGCVTPSSKAVCKAQQSPTPRKSCKSNGPEGFDCAASSLYGLCSKSGINLSYDRCLRLLPKSGKGNNMLEFKQTLERLRFNVVAEKFTPDELSDINTPCVLLLYPPISGPSSQSSKPLGHYIVLWPVGEDKFEIIDYPRPTSILKKEYFIKHLQTVSISDIPALLCFRQNKDSGRQ
jgi:ABC-type bacteriocin/lantibiotic exporter with double-glycine peptidase domain